MKIDIVLALGGFGTRLVGVTNDLVPKPMVNCHGRPFLSHLLEYLHGEIVGIGRYVFLTGHLGGEIRDYYGESYRGVPIDYLHEDQPLGTGGAVRRACELLPLTDFIYLNGDTLHEVDYRKFIKSYFEGESGGPIISAFEMADAGRYGSISLRGTRVTEFHEKKINIEKKLIFSGSAILNSDHILAVEFAEIRDFSTDFLSAYAKKNELHAVIDQGYFVDIGIPDDYFSFCERVIKHESG